MSAIPVWAWWVVYACGVLVAAYLVARYGGRDYSDPDNCGPLLTMAFLWPLCLLALPLGLAVTTGQKVKDRIKASEKFTPGIPVVEDDAR